MTCWDAKSSDLFSSLLSDLFVGLSSRNWAPDTGFMLDSKPATVLWGSDCDCLFTRDVNALDKQVFERCGVSRKGHLA